MNIVRQYVESLPYSEKVKIINGYEQFERDGTIGDEPIRQHVETFFKQNNIDSALTPVVWMQLLAFECHRYFSLAFLEI